MRDRHQLLLRVRAGHHVPAARTVASPAVRPARQGHAVVPGAHGHTVSAAGVVRLLLQSASAASGRRRTRLRHNAFAFSLPGITAVLLLALPWLAPLFSKAMYVVSDLIVVVGTAAVVVWRYDITSMTNLELLLGMLFFGWFTVFLPADRRVGGRPHPGAGRSPAVGCGRRGRRGRTVGIPRGIRPLTIVPTVDQASLRMVSIFPKSPSFPDTMDTMSEFQNPWPAPLATRPLSATVTNSRSKSLSNRYLILAAMGQHPVTLVGLLRSRDTDLMMGALRSLGVEFQVDPDDETTVRVTPPSSGRFTGDVDVYCGLAGTVMRFVPGLAMFADGPVRFDGDAQAYARPMKPVLDGLEQLGAHIDTTGSRGDCRSR